MRSNKRLIIFVVIGMIAAVQSLRLANDSDRRKTQQQQQQHVERPRAAPSIDALERAYQSGATNVQVEGQGIVDRSLKDDNDGSRHQRFILRLDSGRTLLVAHNIDLAPRIEGLREGDTVRFFGEYERNDKGGVLHWTHHDPQGRHVGGWIEHAGRRYE